MFTRFKQCIVAIAILLASFTSLGNDAMLIKVKAQPTPACINFQTLVLGTTYPVGSVFYASGVAITVMPFVPFSPVSVTHYARISNGGLAGGSGNEIAVNNVKVAFRLPRGVSYLKLKFGEFGGTLNITINNSFRTFKNFADIHGTVIGGVSVSVVNGHGNDKGVLALRIPRGSRITILRLVIGGQELWLDDVCWS